MLKRKFSFGLAPLKIPTKASEWVAGKEPVYERSTTPPSPTTPPPVSRRSLDPRTEAQLRAACVALANALQAQGHITHDDGDDDQPDFGAMHREIADRRKSNMFQDKQGQQYSEFAIDEQPHLTRYASKPDQNMQSLFGNGDQYSQHKERYGHARTRSGNQRHMLLNNEHLEARQLEHRLKTTHLVVNDSVSTSYSTPHSAMSEFQPHAFSTTVTSVTSGQSPILETKPEPTFPPRVSSDQHRREALVRADAQTREWAHAEPENKRRPTTEQARNGHKASQPRPTMELSRSSSRTRRIGEGISEYFRPGSRNAKISRQASQNSLRSQNSQGECRPSESSSGWRSWGMRKVSTSNDSATVSRSNSRARGEEARGRPSMQKEVDLNRQLPPLPSLDQWKENEKLEKKQENEKKESQKDQEKKQPGASHIASLMKPTKVAVPAPAVRFSMDNDARPQVRDLKKLDSRAQTTQNRKMRDSALSTTRSHDQSKRNSATINPGRDVHHEHTLSTHFTAPTALVKEMPPLTALPIAAVRGHRRGLSESTDRSSAVFTPNYSRKISMDNPCPRQPGSDSRFPNVVRIQAEDKPKGLKRMFSGWLGKKETTWMDRIERERVKGGVLLAGKNVGDGTPVVRF